MRIIQILPTISFGDGVSNDCIAIKNLLASHGYLSDIYAENIDERLDKTVATRINQMPNLDKSDIVIYHLSTGTELNYKVTQLNCKLIVRYHNITPASYFKSYNEQLYDLCSTGRQQAKYLIQHCDYMIADSNYNKADLYEMGYKGDAFVLPILIPFKDYEKAPDSKIMFRYNDNIKNIIFTGRIAPNKKQEDIIKVFYYYSKYYNKNSRLFLVGSFGGTEKYYSDLKNYAKSLQLNNVIFTGHIKFDQIIAYYHLADLFLCMSEHEGFCIPLVEAMYFNIPIVARNTSAISDTLGESGVLLKDNNPILAAGLINQILESPDLNNTITSGQNKRLKDFSNDMVGEALLTYINKVISDDCCIRRNK